MNTLTECLTVEIEYQNEVRFTLREALRGMTTFRKGVSPQIYVNLMGRDHANLLCARLNQITGVKAKIFGE